MDDLKLNNEERKFLGMMSIEEFNRAIEVLGPKIVNSIKRLSDDKLDEFENKIRLLVNNSIIKN